MYDKKGVLHVGNVVANVTLLSLAAVAGAVSNPLVAGVSTGIYAVKEGIVPLLQKSLEKQGDALYLTVPRWWSGDARSWQDVCTEAELHLPIIIDATIAQLKKEAQAPTEAVVRSVLVQEIGTHLPTFLVPDNRNLFANEVAKSLPKKSAELLRQAVDPLKTDALAKDVARAIQTLERIASAPVTPQTVSIIPSATIATSNNSSPKDLLEQKWIQGAYDVYMCYHLADLAKVREIDVRLKAEGILPWFDTITVRSGGILHAEMENEIINVSTVTVYIGKHAMEDWQNLQLYAFLNQFAVGKKKTIIPVFLPDAPENPEMSVFLRLFKGVDFRQKRPDPFAYLLWGITGKRPPLTSLGL